RAEHVIEPPLALADEAELMEAHALEAQGAPESRPEPEQAEAPIGEEPRADGDGVPEETEEPLNENRAGEIERAIETPEGPPTLIGRYTSGGANYMIFSDGSIEAETDEGAFKFASMGDFKKFLLDRNASKK